MSVAVVTRETQVAYDALRTVPTEPRLVLRATPTIAVLAAFHGAIDAGVPIAPLHPTASRDDEQRLRARLATIDSSPLAFISTSGSTGTPKLVELSRDAYLAHARSSNAHLGIAADDRWLVALPMSHTGGLSVVMRCRAARAAVVLDPSPPLGDTWMPWLDDVTQRLGVTRLSLVPSQLDELVRRRARPASSIRSVLLGGQATPPALAQRAVELGWPIVLSYGLTETCGVCIATRLGDDLSTGVSGVPLPGVRARIVDEQLELSTPAMAQKVHGADVVTSDGWLRTADRARINRDRVAILGRADDVIVTSGYKIDPIEIEAALAAHGLVASVLGVPDERFGSIVAALLVGDRDPTAAIASLPAYKRPRLIRTIDALPRLANGKIDRVAVRRLLT